MQKSIEKIIVDILKHELNMPDNYGITTNGDIIPSVIIYSQNIKLFNTEKMQITVKTVSQRVWSNRNYTKEIKGVFKEIQDINESRMMQVDVYSRNNDARDRFWEVQTALNSVYAQQMMDLYNFKLSNMTNAQNISGIDGSADINRFSITFTALTHQEKIKTIDYYDKFQSNYYGEDGQIAEFHIPATEE